MLIQGGVWRFFCQEAVLGKGRPHRPKRGHIARVYQAHARNARRSLPAVAESKVLSCVGVHDLPLLVAPTKPPALTSITLATSHCKRLHVLCWEP
jgi:hypothetical protein